MNHYVDAFLKEVLEQVRYKRMHPQLAQELNDHIESLKETLMEEEGYTEDKAYEEAVRQMGESVEIGKSLHKMHKPRLEWPTVLLIVGLLGISLITMFTYEYYFSTYIQGASYLYKQFICIVIGAIGLIGMYFMDYKRIEKYSLLLYVAALVLLILTFLWGYELNGAKKWLGIGVFQFETAVLVSPLIIISYIGLARKWSKRGKSGAMFLFVLMMLPTIFYVRGNLAQGIIVFIVLVGIFYKHYPNCLKLISNKKHHFILWIAILGVVGTFFIKKIIEAPHRLERIRAWLNPSIDPMGEGWLTIQLRNMCKGASLVGNDGLFYTLEQLGTTEVVPPYGSSVTDYILNFMIGILGILPAIILVCMIIGLLIRCFKTAAKVREGYGHDLLISISTLFSVQFILSILSNLGILPSISGTYMPFVSYGGTNLVCNMILIGFFLGIYRRKDINPVQLISEGTAEAKRQGWMQWVNAFFEIEDKEIDKDFKDNFEGELSNRALAEAALNFLRGCEEVESVEVVFKDQVQE
ncbi:FtsW/RodA/SpoVE family cell cycle protein [Cellulosilyticum lentocellum]|uniref:Cell cycle protein n=1 Tax=Cellulosilyticum lentocellum (strain ATCC 49066 / DSM 5427 / NCIMB 11756 / RHM5) TaxID=642492 RepID=F2JHE2_CELLD|nr:FtsW/RodA/SpoVE family cell cycle protein [Cellulosilyticum lentocellum]ADZ83040.1 cell cycle protein [Cellulosilyticum lentocellum DSM 5427]